MFLINPERVPTVANAFSVMALLLVAIPGLSSSNPGLELANAFGVVYFNKALLKKQLLEYYLRLVDPLGSYRNASNRRNL